MLSSLKSSTTPMTSRSSILETSGGKRESKHFQSLQIFTSYAEPGLNEFLTRKEQIELENKQKDEEDRLYRKFLEGRREEEEKIKNMDEEEREVYLFQLNRDERSKVIKLTEKHCKQMMDMIYRKKMAYFEKGGDEDWKAILARSYPRDPPEVEPPVYNKEQVYENNYDVFEEVDATAIRIAHDDYKLFSNLVRDLIEGYTSDLEKARVLFRYMTERKFSHESWFLYYPEEGNKRGAPTQLMRGVEFGLETKALLFKRLCAYAGLHCSVIKGYSKATDYLPGEEFVDSSYRNSWNSVFVAGGWRLIQANWGMMSVNNKMARETRQIYQDHYFLTDPDKFIFEFYPIDEKWQLMEQSITLQEFEDLPLLRSTFFHYNLGLEGNAASVLDCDELGQARVRILAPPDVSFHYEVSFFKSGNTAVTVEGEMGKVPLGRFLMMSTEDEMTVFQFHAPQKGTYLLDIFCAVSPTYEQCLTEEPIKYVNICRFKLNCHGVDKPNVALPDCAPGEWGPTKAVKLIGLIPLSHLYPVINAAPDTNVNLKEEKPLTLNMEFEMTKLMLDFVIRLHKNGDRPYDERGKKRDARYRIKDEKYLLVDIKVPQEGQYGLDIFARERWEEKMVHCCKYLINCDV
ncbi:hillarin-like [Tigriopus californicus]|uniref:hillarin-like n=1 Tax=Tigriopus californicus TaxID=6832 RepID=UPI0027DA44C8|nr:hillarin-like [Tigriopus californicus]XP_059079356.1 hillarin-like [Tigriopus californicus]